MQIQNIYMQRKRQGKPKIGGSSNEIFICIQDLPPRINVEKNNLTCVFGKSTKKSRQFPCFRNNSYELVYYSIMFVGTYIQKKLSQIAMIDNVLLGVGLHKGNITIKNDMKMSRGHVNVPPKQSLGVINACHFIENVRVMGRRCQWLKRI